MRSFVPALTFILAGCTLVAADIVKTVDVDPDVNVDVEVEVLVSHDGTCGNGRSCYGSQFGGCCDASGHCGSTKAHCGYGCQLGLGYCEYTVGKVSPDGTCGGSNGYICEGSRWGPCCSQYHFCGSGPEYCDSGDKTDRGPLARRQNATQHSPGPSIPNNNANNTTPKPAPHVPIVAITPSIIPSSANHAASSNASSLASAAACAEATPKPQPEANPVFKREEMDPNCTPCEGQGGSPPYCGADHTTNHYKFTPKTCRTIYYNLDILNVTVAPDGRSRIALTVNGQMPGPLIEANWGDHVVVTVNNKLQDNGTSIHFHGIRQLNNTEYDGVPSITQCPVAPGDSLTYKFVATNYGTSWYHSHYAIQAWEGVAGPMIIHGPTSATWDEDLGAVMLSDWSRRTVDSLYDLRQDSVHGGPLILENGLINGKNTWGVDGTNNQTGSRFEFDKKLESGKTYLIRIINSSIQSTFKFYIDGHDFEVIAMDFTNIVPYKTNIVNIHIGQRYMLLVKANATPGNYWMRADNQRACAGLRQSDDIRGIVRYANAGNDTAIPTSTGYNYTTECVDEPLASLVPTAPLDAFPQTDQFTEDVTFGLTPDKLFRWYLSGATFFSRWEDPTLLRVLGNDSTPTYSGNLILDLPRLGEWVYIIVQTPVAVPHPIHLHGHDFFILGSGPGHYTNQPLNLHNPPRRDTANMPAAGWLALAFETDNPGTWLMHCHIGWHTSMGFALQIIEGRSLIKSTIKDECGLRGTCKRWNEWVEKTSHKQHHSGV